jgi:hypothetical protein
MNTSTKKYLAIILLLTAGCLHSYAQHIIKGSVKGNNQPISGATIRLKGATLGTTSDSTGQFSITVKANSLYRFLPLVSNPKNNPSRSPTHLPLCRST